MIGGPPKLRRRPRAFRCDAPQPVQSAMADGCRTVMGREFAERTPDKKDACASIAEVPVECVAAKSSDACGDPGDACQERLSKGCGRELP